MRRQLVLVAVAISSMVALAFVLPLAALVRSGARDHALTAGERDARRVADAVTLGASAGQLDSVLADTERRHAGRQAQVFLADGVVVGDGRPADDGVALARAQGTSFRSEAPGGAEVLVVVLRPTGTDVVRVFLPQRELEAGVLRSWLVLGAVAVALVIGAVLVADRLAASIVRPVRALARTTRRLASGDSAARVDPAGPLEVAKVGKAVNTLADRIDALLTAERELVADLSHRLRTPLTALRLDAETIAEPEVGDRVRRGVEAMDVAVRELIAEARDPHRGGIGATDLVETTANRAAYWAALAEDQSRDWTVSLPPRALLVPVHAADLEAALDALFDNIFEHTPDGAGAAVTVVEIGAGPERSARLVVDDEGPGFPGADVVDRGVSGAGSSGLGLDIVRRTVVEAGGALHLARRNPHGARVELTFPLAANGHR